MDVTPDAALATFDALLSAALATAAEPSPEDQPYERKYEAIEALETMLLCAEPQAPTAAQRALINHRLGVLNIETDEPSAGETRLEAALEVLRPATRQHPAALLGALNQLGCLWTGRGELDKALVLLSEAEAAYRGGGCGEEPGPGSEAEHTLTLFYLAQLHGHRGKAATSAAYCLATLQRQLGAADGGYNRLECAVNCMGLASFYSSEQDFARAGHCLAAADELMPVGAEEASPERAGLLRAWGELCILRLAKGAKQLIDGVEREDDVAAKAAAAEAEAAEIALRGARFCSFSKWLPAVKEFTRASFAVPRDFEAARAVFKRGSASLGKAKEFFVLDGFVTDHCEVLLGLADLYKNLAVFEPDAGRRTTMLKRRAAYLEPLIGELNEQYYGEFHRRFNFELGDSWDTITKIRLLAHEHDGKELSAEKLQASVDKCSFFYRAFCASFRWDVEGSAEEQKQVAEAVEDGSMQWLLNVNFSLAKNLSRIGSREYQTKAQEQYQWMAEFVKRLELPYEEGALAGKVAALLTEKIARMAPAEQ